MAKQKPNLNQADIEILKQVFETKEDAQKRVSKLEAKADSRAVSLFKYIDERLEQQTQDIRSEFSHLPTKEEFYSSQLSLMERIQSNDEKTDMLPGQVEDHEIRIDKIETNLGLV